ncbi:MAG: hypothetical protein KIS67_22255 [Verrucomicrobiae bacterium]|nr:hypothetical protein [Verrucomicrobiae bacterium]
MTINTTTAEEFLESSGIAQAITQDAVLVGLRHKLTGEGAVPFIRRDRGLRLRVLLSRKWEASSVETIEGRLAAAILNMNSYARIQGIELRKHGRYIEGEIGVT